MFSRHMPFKNPPSTSLRATVFWLTEEKILLIYLAENWRVFSRHVPFKNPPSTSLRATFEMLLIANCFRLFFGANHRYVENTAFVAVRGAVRDSAECP